MINFPDVSGWLVLVLAAVAAAVLLRRLEPYLPSRRARRVLRRWVSPPLELLAAGAFAGWLISRLLDGQSAWTGLAYTLLVLAVAWTARAGLEDFVAGVILRMEGNVERDRRLEVNGVSGRIGALGFRSVAVETDDGTIVRVPWRMTAREPVRLGAAVTAVRSHSFTIDVPRTRPIERILEDIPAAALISPWASTTRLPEVRLRGETATDHVLEITVHALDARFAPQIEADIRNRLGIVGNERTATSA